MQVMAQNAGCFTTETGFIALMMEAAKTSETLVNFYQTTRRYIPEDSYLRTHRLRFLVNY
jgi:hypothetical protein